MPKEIELKFTLTKEQYELLITNKTKTNIIRNYYFDTGNTNETLRLRTIDNENAVFTLKRKLFSGDGLTESVEMDFCADINRLDYYIKNGINPTFMSPIADVDTTNSQVDKTNSPIQKNGTTCTKNLFKGENTFFPYVGMLMTERNTVFIDGIFCEVDKCSYLGKTDYEIECEDFENHVKLRKILSDMGITQHSLAKRKRFQNRLGRLLNQGKILPSGIKAVLFDLDGTIIQSEFSIIPSMEATLKHFGWFKEDMDLRRFIGPPLRGSFATFTDDKRLIEDAVAFYSEHYEKIDADSTIILYEGIADFIQKLHNRGFITGVATSKPEKKAKRILEKLGLTRSLDFIVGADKLAARHSKTEVLSFALDTNSLIRDTSVLVGDTRFDFEGANAVGIAAVGVTYGYGSYRELISYPHIAVVDSVEELEKLFL